MPTKSVWRWKSECVLSLDVILSHEKNQIMIRPCLLHRQAHDLMKEWMKTNTTLNSKHILLRIISLNGFMWCLYNFLQTGLHLCGFYKKKKSHMILFLISYLLNHKILIGARLSVRGQSHILGSIYNTHPTPRPEHPPISLSWASTPENQLSWATCWNSSCSFNTSSTHACMCCMWTFVHIQVNKLKERIAISHTYSICMEPLNTLRPLWPLRLPRKQTFNTINASETAVLASSWY